MLYTLAVVLLVLWLLGLVTSYTLGGVLHILLVIAIIMLGLALNDCRYNSGYHTDHYQYHVRYGTESLPVSCSIRHTIQHYFSAPVMIGIHDSALLGHFG